MDYQKYKEIINECNDGIRNLGKTINDTTSAYVEEHREFKKGDMVEVLKRDWQTKELKRLGVFVITSAHIGYSNGNIEYKFNKLKKDGTPSEQSAGIYYYDEIRAIQ